MNKETESSEQLLSNIVRAVDKICVGKQFVIVDGVGYPAVGSIVGVSNATVAAALKCDVILVGKHGVGDAVDSFNLNACYFEAHNVLVRGVIFNRLASTGYYSLERCRESVKEYFKEARPTLSLYGWLPEILELKDASPAPAPTSTAVDAIQSLRDAASGCLLSPEEENIVNRWIATFLSYIDVDTFIKDIVETDSDQLASASTISNQVADKPSIAVVKIDEGTLSSEALRERITKAAIDEGADCGG